MEVTKELCDELSKIEGKIRGAVLSTDMFFILHRGDVRDLSAIEERSRELGYEIKHNEIDNTGWYDLGLRLISFLLVIEHFNLSESDIRVMGSRAPRVSSVVSLSLKYFVTLNIFSKRMPKLWIDHYTIGNLKLEKLDRDAGEFIMHINDFYHPINDVSKELARLYVMIFLEGYFESALKMVVKEVEGKMSDILVDEKHVYEFRSKF
jgi:hypothetical protein